MPGREGRGTGERRWSPGFGRTGAEATGAGASDAETTDAGATGAEPTDAEGWEVYWRVIRRVPSGNVATYGQIARMAGRPGHARQVGWALHALSESEAEEVPWQRIVNARGEISQRSEPGREGLQQALLEDEGIELDLRGRIDLQRFGWRGDT